MIFSVNKLLAYSEILIIDSIFFRYLTLQIQKFSDRMQTPQMEKLCPKMANLPTRGVTFISKNSSRYIEKEEEF